MSNETYLDWLARNVHVWHFFVDALAEVNNGAVKWQYPNLPKLDGFVTRQQWLDRRAELQRKPSWQSAPEWAEWLAQHSTGFWQWGRGTPTQALNGIWYSPEFGATQWTGYHGMVLGDWSDTLERRTAPAKTRAQVEVELVNAVAEVFQPIISIEDNKEQSIQQDNGWFERGELPPVWVECEIHHQCWNDDKFEKVQVLAITRDYLIVDYATYEQHYSRKDISFRPIRTEREKAIEDIAKIICKSGLIIDYFKDAAIAIYDAGYRKEQK